MRINRPFVYTPRYYDNLIRWVLDNGMPYKPRGMETTEVMDAHLVVRDPRDRIIFDEARKMNIGFAIMEALQILCGDDDAAWLSYFIPKIADFSKDGKVMGAYGPRLRQWEPRTAGSIDQVAEAIARLKKDPDSRQAVMTIFTPNDFDEFGDIVPCTLSLQFLIREGKLHGITTMRSNDIVWGLTYDLFTFTLIQEFIATRLGVPLGDYRHRAGSLHLYHKRDKEIIDNLTHRRNNYRMMAMDKSFDPYKVYEAAKAATDLMTREVWFLAEEFSSFSSNLVLSVRYIAARKEKQFEEAEAAYSAISDHALRGILRIWPLNP